MKPRYLIGSVATFLILLLLFSTVGDNKCPELGVYSAGDIAGVAFALFAIIFSAVAVGYVLGHDDGKEEGFRSR